MKKRGHIILAALLGFGFVFLSLWLGFKWFDFGIRSLLVMSAVIVFYSLLPDLDHKNSTITHWFFGIGILGLVYGIFGLLTGSGFGGLDYRIVLIGATGFLIVTYISSNFVPHRGKIHTVQMGIVACSGLWFLFQSVALCGLAYVAWHSHLFGDGYFFKIK